MGRRDERLKLAYAQDWAEALEDPSERFSFTSILGTGDSSIVYEALDSGKKLLQASRLFSYEYIYINKF